MPWCPNCKTEYEESVQTCADCGAELIPNPPEEEWKDLGEPVELLQTTNEFEADIFVSKLQANNIPAFLKHPGFGSVAKVYCGRSNFPISVMVPKSLETEARELLKPGQDYDFSEAETMPQPAESAKNPMLQKFVFYLIGFIFVLGLLAYIFSRY